MGKEPTSGYHLASLRALQKFAVVMRSGWGKDAHWGFFDAGPHGISGHQHYDKLHLSVAAHGRPLLVDNGRFTHRQDIWRQYFTGSYGHNVILVNGHGQHEGIEVVVEPPRNHAMVTPAFDFAANPSNTAKSYMSAAILSILPQARLCYLLTMVVTHLNPHLRIVPVLVLSVLAATAAGEAGKDERGLPILPGEKEGMINVRKALEAKAMRNPKWPAEWLVFGPLPRTFTRTEPATLAKIPDEPKVDGKAYSPRRFRMTDEIWLDLKPLLPAGLQKRKMDQKEYSAYCFVEFECPADGTLYVTRTARCRAWSTWIGWRNARASTCGGSLRTWRTPHIQAGPAHEGCDDETGTGIGAGSRRAFFSRPKRGDRGTDGLRA